MSNGVASDERTPLLPAEASVERGGNGPGEDPRLISDALTRIISAVSLEALVPSDILRPNSSHTQLSDAEASSLDYGYAVTAVLYYRSQKLKEEERGVAPLDLYSQWTQEKSSEGDVTLVDRHVDVLWTQFLSQYRTDQEIDTVLWSKHKKDASSDVLLRAAQFLAGPIPYAGLLTHPLVEAALARRWKHGRHYTTSQASSGLFQRADDLFCTPRNTHLLALASHLTYLCLLAHYLLYPPGRVSTDIRYTYHPDVYPHTIGLLIFSLANALFVPMPYNYLYLTSLAALALPFPGLPQPGDGFFDILLLVFTLHLLTLHRPFASSVLYVRELSSSVPLAGFVHRNLVDGITPSLFYFALPLIVSIVFLSLSLDEDFLRAASTPFPSLSSATAAPMETRNTFLAIVLVTLLGLFFSVFATTVAVPAVRASALLSLLHHIPDMDAQNTMKKGEEVPASPTSAYKFEALLFSSIDSNLAVPLSLNHPSKSDTKPYHEAKARRDSRASRSSIHRSSSVVFRALPPIRRMPSLQVPSLTDISNPHNIPNPRSLNQISETEATSFKLKLPLTLVHPNSPYVPWELPVRQKILCAPLIADSEDSTGDNNAEGSGSEERSRADTQRDKKPLSSVWNALKSAPRRVKTKCRRLLGPRGREALDLATGDSGASSNASGHMDVIVAGPDDEDAGDDHLASYIPQHHSGIPLSPTASFRSTETHSLAIWLSERQRKFLDKDCESARLMSIDEYERAGSWIRRKGDVPLFTASRTSYQCSFVSDHGDAISGVFKVFGSDGDLEQLSLASPIVESSTPCLRTSSPTASRTAFGPKRIMEEERLSRIVHRASMLSYIAERPLSSANDWGLPPSST